MSRADLDCEICHPPEGVKPIEVIEDMIAQMLVDLEDHGLGAGPAMGVFLKVWFLRFDLEGVGEAVLRALDTQAPNVAAAFEAMGLRDLLQKTVERAKEMGRERADRIDPRLASGGTGR